MNRPCPRCGQNLIVHPRGPATVTCPVCLAPIATGSRPLPMPPLPVPVISLAYEQRGADIELGLNKDLRWSAYGICVFAVITIGGYFAFLRSFDFKVPVDLWLGAATVIIALAAIAVLWAHRRRVEKSLIGAAPPRGPYDRIAALFALGAVGVVTAVLMSVVTVIISVIVFIVTCKPLG